MLLDGRTKTEVFSFSSLLGVDLRCLKQKNIYDMNSHCLPHHRGVFRDRSVGFCGVTYPTVSAAGIHCLRHINYGRRGFGGEQMETKYLFIKLFFSMQTVTAMVQQVMHYIDETPDIETCIDLIKTLNSASAGRIYVEIERTRLIKKLAKIKEEQGLIAEATDLMKEIVVDTFGAMAKTEKIAFILEQGSLRLDRQDYI
eukprot:TRINITY_DN4363_c0_g3_i1.p1 TRINITY_DN4363_c0_g3~~TRINITY_DN4363_c0_g3_i1.p1  ORF type:complete len:199 (+),score=31.73 TRINITY_DN4363_c0_g3_i1:250-846(+)